MKGLKYDPTRMDELKALIESRAGGEKFEPITLEKFIVGRNAVYEIPSLLLEASRNRGKSVLVVSDETPIKRGNAILRDLVVQMLRKEGMEVNPLVLRSGSTGLLHADMEAVLAVKGKIVPDGAIVAIGAGTITDICKYAVCLLQIERTLSEKIPLLILQTATSGSAFGSNQSVILKDGVKRTLPSVYPTIVLADIEVMTSGLPLLNRSGFGDMSGILISSVDWNVSQSLGMAKGYSEFLVDRMRESGQALLEVSPELKPLSPRGIEILDKILILMGIVSSMGFGTAPISGFEHMISHALDMEALATGRRLSLHGAQVGVGTVYASVAYNLFEKEFSRKKIDLNRCYPSDGEAFQRIRRGFGHLDEKGTLIEELWTHYREKLTLWREKRDLFEKFLGEWDKSTGCRKEMKTRLPDPVRVIRGLTQSGNPVIPEELTPSLSREEMKFAFLHAPFMRNRFIIADILGLTGILNDHFWERVDSEVRRIRLTGG